MVLFLLLPDGTFLALSKKKPQYLALIFASVSFCSNSSNFFPVF